MKKALVITVGTGRNGKDMANGILFSIKKQSPNYFVFIVSSRSKTTTIPYILKGLEKDGNSKNIDIHVVSCDINDMEDLIVEFSMIMEDLISNKDFRKQDISIDYTSGTKSMSAAIVYTAIKYEIDSISYIYGKRDDSGRVMPGTERLNVLSPTQIQLERKIRYFKVLFNQYQFAAAIQVLNSGTIPFQRKNYIYQLILLAEGYDAWDKFNFSSALDKLEQVDRNTLDGLNILPKVGKQRGLLKKQLLSKKQTIFHAQDIYSNALRRSEEGKYDDAVARLYRMVEMIAQIEFMELYSCSTGAVPPEMLSAELKEAFSSNYIEEENCYKIGLVRTYQALKAKDSEAGKMFFERLDEFKVILNSRNNSILAHGNQPVKESTFNKFNDLIQKLFDIGLAITFPKLLING